MAARQAVGHAPMRDDRMDGYGESRSLSHHITRLFYPRNQDYENKS
jgi:hypothetical protein